MMRPSVFVVALALISCSAASLAQTGMAKPVLKASPVPQQMDPAVVPDLPDKAVPEVTPGYVIGADDGLQVTVWQEANLSGFLTVRPDGMISLPLIGDVPAAGSTPMHLSAELATRLKKYITAPLVTVTLVKVNSKRVFLLGEVQHVGPLPITPNMSILQAISSSGGLTSYANAKRIYILRGEVGHQKKIFFNYKKAIKTGDEQGIVLQAGDTIVVP